QAPHRVAVERLLVFGEIADQIDTMARALIGLADRVDLKPDVMQTQIFEQSAGEQDDFGVDVGPAIAERLDTELMKLAIAAALRPLMTKHGALIPQAQRSVVEQVVLDHRAHDRGRALGTKGQLLAIEGVDEG